MDGWTDKDGAARRDQVFNHSPMSVEKETRGACTPVFFRYVLRQDISIVILPPYYLLYL